MVRDKGLIILFAIGIFLILLILGFLFFVRFTTPQDERIILPSPTPARLTNPQSSFPIGDMSSPLQIVSFDPEEGGKYGPGQQITITFTKELDPAKVFVSVAPEKPLKLSFGNSPKQVTVLPEFGWDPNVAYTITVKANTSSMDGTLLGKDASYTLSISADYQFQGP